ncbi:MAG: glycosyltransferase family 4 protein [Deltaproteobacteria bacterium]|nr:glycosyltransferase family 4 protein [Deltaproteobacteria bacterium]
MKVCMISEARSVHTRRLAAGLAEQGVEVHLATRDRDNVPGVTVHRVPLYARGPYNRPAAFFRARRMLADIRPDVYHLFGLFSLFSLPGVLLARGLRPLVVSGWGSDVAFPGPGSGARRRFIRRSLLARAERVTMVSAYLAAEAKKHLPPETPVEVVFWGVDTEVFRPAEAPRREGPVRAAFAKALHALSGPDLLVDAFARARERAAVPMELLIAGDGPMEAEVREAARKLSGAVRFLGRLEGEAAVADFYRDADFAVLSSRRESFGMSGVEAQACGLAVAGFAVGGVPEVVRDGETGLLVPPGDVEALADAMVRLAEDADLRRSMGAAARRRAEERFERKRCVQTLIDVYKEAARHG